MASITPILAFQDTTQSTTSTSTFVSASCTTSALGNAVKYLVLYRGSCGGSDTAATPSMRLQFGATTLGEVRGEGRGLSQHWDGVNCCGWTVVTGDGTSTLAFEISCGGTAGDTCYAGAMAIVAVPLTLLTENSDYWFSGTDSATNEVSGATINGWDTQRTASWTMSAGDYLVLMSSEGQHSTSGATTNGTMVRFAVAGSVIGPDRYQEEWEDNGDYRSDAIARVCSVAGGSTTFAIEVGSRGAAESNYRRSRIFVLRAAAFAQIVQTLATAGTTTTSTSFVDFTALNTTVTPTTTAYVVALGSFSLGNSTTQTTKAQLRNDTDATLRNVDAGEYGNGPGFTSGEDQLSCVLVGCEQISAAKSYKVQFRVDGGTGSIGRNDANTADLESRLIFWELTTAAAAAPALPPEDPPPAMMI